MILFDHANKLSKMLRDNPRQRTFKLSRQQVSEIESDINRAACELSEWRESARKLLEASSWHEKSRAEDNERNKVT